MSWGRPYQPPGDPFHADRDIRIKRIRENRVIFNGYRDESVYVAFQDNIANRSSEVFYVDEGANGAPPKPIVPAGVLAAELEKMYDYEVAFVFTEGKRNTNMLAGYGDMGFFNLDGTLVPVSSVLNGARAKTRAALMRMIRPMGITELTGRATEAKGLTIIAGGVTVAKNRSHVPFVTGDLLAAVPPRREDARSYSGFAGEIADAAGRITMVLEPVKSLSYFEPKDLREAIWQEYGLEIDAAGETQFVRMSTRPGNAPAFHEDTKRAKCILERTLAEQDFAHSVVELIESQVQNRLSTEYAEAAAVAVAAAGAAAAAGVAYATAAEERDARTRAILQTLAATFYQEGAGANVPAADIDTFCARIAVSDAANVGLRTRIGNNIKFLLNLPHAKKMFNPNPIERAVHALKEHKAALERSIMGVVIVGCAPGGHSQLHLSRYQL